MGNASHYFGRRKLGNVCTIPERAGPHVRLVFAEMARQGISYDRLVERSGVQRAALKAWRHKNRPSWENLTAALNALSWDLVPVPRAGTLPAAIEAELLALAERFDKTMPVTFAALLAVMARQQINPAEHGPASRWAAE